MALRSLARCFGGLCGASHGGVLDEEHERVQRLASSSAVPRGASQQRGSSITSGKLRSPSHHAASRRLDTFSAGSCASVEPVPWDQLSESGANPSHPLLMTNNPCLQFRPAKQHSHCKLVRA